MEPLKSTLTLVLILLTAILLIGCSKPTSESLDSFASCLNENGAVMYGAYWCGHCQSQKEIFGTSFAKVNYVECTEDEQACNDAGITGYPTWKFADGTSLPGAQQFSTLAGKTGCKMP